MIEIWLPVEGFLGIYEVSNIGRVRSLDRFITQTTKAKRIQKRRMLGCVLKPHSNIKRNGYRHVILQKAGKEKCCRVASLVAKAFLGRRPVGFVICHNNGISTDDRASNLRYDTPKNNTADMRTHGTLKRGEDSPNAKLTTAQVRQIKKSKTPAIILANRFNVHPGHINNIRCGRSWAHV